jgi:osmotically-inducible protein OsmY
MSQSATLPTREHPGKQKNALQTAVPLLTHSLEDLRLTERIERALRATGYGALRAIKVSVNARIVHLVGRVPTYYLKQIAQATALTVPGGHELHNGLDVVTPN